MKLLDRLRAWKEGHLGVTWGKQKEQAPLLIPPGAVKLSDADLAQLHGGAGKPCLRYHRRQERVLKDAESECVSSSNVGLDGSGLTLSGDGRADHT